MNAVVTQITKDPAYNTVRPNDFGAMIQVERYGTPLDRLRQDHHRHP